MPDLSIKDCFGDPLVVETDAEGTIDLSITELRSRNSASAVFEPTDEGITAIRSLVNELREWLGDANPKGSVAPVRASEVSFNEGLMRLAAVHGKTVTFRYAKGDGAVIETRSLKPETVTEVKGHMTFTGYDPDRDEPRAYRIDRMKGEVRVA
jgi:predicted DNA-binding transcriptional regulator YafY